MQSVHDALGMTFVARLLLPVIRAAQVGSEGRLPTGPAHFENGGMVRRLAQPCGWHIQRSPYISQPVHVML